MKKMALSMLLLLFWYGPARADDCDCRPIEYQQLMTMPVSEIQAKMEQYERLKERYIHGGSTNCFYTCATAYEQLHDAKAEKEREMTKDRAARRTAEQGSMLHRHPSPR
ncbi:hypothetical protein KP005_05145 [Geomonas nitrogeniifigens]|uniref:Secreted protein n=1 Tax=Geomonas diazotrophica TaxID=2843197 RepID=A0ABX8JL17_9BACT|nr:hypothetical protein [Geomonas nitrogeniifigens]QWV98676.1 hypothetical protein KP005_05145 [Geomonas nitrogeniifigens]